MNWLLTLAALWLASTLTVAILADVVTWKDTRPKTRAGVIIFVGLRLTMVLALAYLIFTAIRG